MFRTLQRQDPSRLSHLHLPLARDPCAGGPRPRMFHHLGVQGFGTCGVYGTSEFRMGHVGVKSFGVSRRLKQIEGVGVRIELHSF